MITQQKLAIYYTRKHFKKSYKIIAQKSEQMISMNEVHVLMC